MVSDLTERHSLETHTKWGHESNKINASTRVGPKNDHPLPNWTRTVFPAISKLQRFQEHNTLFCVEGFDSHSKSTLRTVLLLYILFWEYSRKCGKKYLIWWRFYCWYLQRSSICGGSNLSLKRHFNGEILNIWKHLKLKSHSDHRRHSFPNRLTSLRTPKSHGIGVAAARSRGR